ncbi:flagellar hook capping FlgD N-terminal domain-containing protein [Legionella dresdenensis]|uniref:Basal-body rod modification protein FlgD n=1 Tax=Legionella dresdenensis TaxID=450200 RepID=A0ABV8CGP0_9GAMM
MTDAIAPSTGIEQADYMQLFMQELTYQDPLKPIDNREFMAQMAQFSLLQQVQEINEATRYVPGMLMGIQALSLLGKQVILRDTKASGQVQSVSFKEAQPLLMVKMDNDKIEPRPLKDIEEVK